MSDVEERLPYEYLEDVATADVAFRAWAPDLEGTFVAAADATTNVLVEDLSTIRPAVRRSLRLEADPLDMLLFAFLNELVFLKDAERLLLRVPAVRITATPGGHRLEALATGEALDLTRHATRVDVKAVTLYRLSVQRVATGWEATVVLDV
jgi:protein archease